MRRPSQTTHDRPEISSWSLKVLGLRIHARAGGAGMPVVLLHGYGVSEERLPLITQPTLVVRGEADGFIGQDWAETAATAREPLEDRFPPAPGA
jgi:pimeloyl-ACP methyl ester carboxylesterase